MVIVIRLSYEEGSKGFDNIRVVGGSGIAGNVCHFVLCGLGPSVEEV